MHSGTSASTPGPWQHMASTYAWVAEQEMDKRNGKTEQWVLEQQITFDGHKRRPRSEKSVRRKLREEEIYTYAVEAERWMRQEEEARRVAEARNREKARLIQDELRRIEERVRRRREEEKHRIVEERIRTLMELRERERKERANAEKSVALAWKDYETRWANLAGSSEPLSFSDIPWPLSAAPAGVDQITPAGISSFLLSPLHSQGQTRKDRIRSAQLRWHPDRFQRLMKRVNEGEKGSIEEGAGIIARCLNDLMSREKGHQATHRVCPPRR